MLYPVTSRRSFIILVVALVFITSALITFGTLAKHAVQSLVNPITDPLKYPQFLAMWKPGGLIDLFPPSIPAEAKNVLFSEFPGLGQGGAWMQLQMQLPANEIAAIETDVRARTDHVYTPDHAFYLPAAKGDWPIPNYHATNNPNQSQFPSTFKIYVVNAVDRGGFGTWDPTESYGIAISVETNEIVYWAEQ